MPDIAGLKLIVPTSVAGSGVSVSASGKVTFTAATSVSVNGCFSASYDNYLVVVRGTASSTIDLQYRLRVSGADATGTNYVRQYLVADGTSVSGARSTLTLAVLGYIASTAMSGDHVYFYGPALAQPTAMRNVNVSGASSAFIADNACTHSLSTAYDGFTAYVGSGNITGALTIYGLSQ